MDFKLDIMDNTTDCGKYCFKPYIGMACCNLCKYPMLSDNVSLCFYLFVQYIYLFCL